MAIATNTTDPISSNISDARNRCCNSSNGDTSSSSWSSPTTSHSSNTFQQHQAPLLHQSPLWKKLSIILEREDGTDGEDDDDDDDTLLECLGSSWSSYGSSTSRTSITTTCSTSFSNNSEVILDDDDAKKKSGGQHLDRPADQDKDDVDGRCEANIFPWTTTKDGLSTTTIPVGMVVASENAFLDDILHSSFVEEDGEKKRVRRHGCNNRAAIGTKKKKKQSTITVFDTNQVYLYTDRQFEKIRRHHHMDDDASGGATSASSCCSEFVVTYHHTLRYKGDVVWEHATACWGDGIRGMEGETSSCQLTEKQLRVRVGTKTQLRPNRSTGPGGGTPAFVVGVNGIHGLGDRKRYTLELTDILSASSNRYQDQHLS